MGTRFAQSYANLYMGDYENNYIMSQYPWKLCIDYLVFIWNNSKEECNKFTSFMHNNGWGLTLSREINSESINYLDITLFHEEGKIL